MFPWDPRNVTYLWIRFVRFPVLDAVRLLELALNLPSLVLSLELSFVAAQHALPSHCWRLKLTSNVPVEHEVLPWIAFGGWL